MKKIVLSLFLISSVISSMAQTTASPTWSADVACIIYSHCSSCHNPNSIAPFSLLSYQDAKAEMINIKYYVSNKLMPPYLPNTNYQQYADMRNLTDQEIRTLVAWVDSGAPLGDTTSVLPQPTFASGNVISHPDLTARIPDYTVPITGADLYRCFVLTTPLTSDQFIKTMEIIPGNRAAVHHVLVYQDTSYALVAKDSADPMPGYTNFGGTGSNTSRMIGGWVPGSGVDSMPTGMAIKVTRGSRIIIQVHYPMTAQGLLDSTRVNILFDTASNLRNVNVTPLLNHVISMTDGPLTIPADSVRTFHEVVQINSDLTLVSIAPHAHLVCVAMKAFAVTPAGDTIPLIDIPRWDFHWQGGHSFQRPIKLPAGSILHGIAKYDNSYNNPDAPQPLATVNVGEATTNEMMLFFLSFLPYQTGDENIIVDKASHEAHYMNCTSSYQSLPSTGIIEPGAEGFSIFPNPSRSLLNYSSETEISAICITDLTGKTIKQIAASDTQGQISVSDIASGIYFIRMQNRNGESRARKFIKD